MCAHVTNPQGEFLFRNGRRCCLAVGPWYHFGFELLFLSSWRRICCYFQSDFRHCRCYHNAVSVAELFMTLVEVFGNYCMTFIIVLSKKSKRIETKEAADQSGSESEWVRRWGEEKAATRRMCVAACEVPCIMCSGILKLSMR